MPLDLNFILLKLLFLEKDEIHREPCMNVGMAIGLVLPSDVLGFWRMRDVLSMQIVILVFTEIKLWEFVKL